MRLKYCEPDYFVEINHFLTDKLRRMKFLRLFRFYVASVTLAALAVLSASAEEAKHANSDKADGEKMLSDVAKQSRASGPEIKVSIDEANPDYLDLQLTGNDSEALLYLKDAIGEALSSNLEIKIEAIVPGIASQRIVQALADFDPVFEARIRYENLLTPQTTQEFVSTGGTPIIDNAAAGRGSGGNLPGRQSRLFAERNASSDLLLTGRLITGTEYELGLKANRYSNDLTRDPLITSIDPEYRAFAGLSFSQPLLQGFGIQVNKTPILISQSERRIAALDFKSIASQIVKEVAGAYYDLYLSYEDVKVKRFDIGVAQVQISEQREQLERGAATEMDVSIARTVLLESFERFLLARQTMLTKNADLLLRIQTDFDPLNYPLYLPQSAPGMSAPPLDLVRITEDALNYRPEYLAAVETVKKMDVELKYRRNQKMPKLDIEATIGTLGLNDSVSNSFSKAFDHQGHEYGVGLVFSVPLGNRKAKALYSETKKVSNQAVLRVKWEEVQTNILINQKMIGVETHKKRILAARHTREAEELSLEHARDNLEKGGSTEIVVRVIEHTVLEARLREVAAAADMQKALLELWDVNGTLLQRFGILIDTEIDREPTLRFGTNGEINPAQFDEEVNGMVELEQSPANGEQKGVEGAPQVSSQRPKTLFGILRHKRHQADVAAETVTAGEELAELPVGETKGNPRKSRGFFGLKFRKDKEKQAGEFVPYGEEEMNEESKIEDFESSVALTGEEKIEPLTEEGGGAVSNSSKSKSFKFKKK